MSQDLYQVISLASRYLFALLGVLIVCRAFLWLLSDRRERRKRLRSLPDAGMIGEMVVLAGNDLLPPGSVLPVPREGVLGYIRTCDLVVPCEGVRKRHLWFFFEDGTGLIIRPRSGCEALIDTVPVDCHSRKPDTVMAHGSCLQAGSAVLRLRVFAGLDNGAGTDVPDTFRTAEAYPGVPYPDTTCSNVPYAGVPYPGEPYQTDPETTAVGSPDAFFTGIPSVPTPQDASQSPAPRPLPPEDPAEALNAPVRKRRSARWEDDWSE